MIRGRAGVTSVRKDWRISSREEIPCGNASGEGVSCPYRLNRSAVFPRPHELIEALGRLSTGRLKQSEYEQVLDAAVLDTIRRFEKTGSPVITDGEQAKPSFATYPLTGVSSLAADGVTIPIRRRAHASASQAHRRAVPVWDLRRDLPEECDAADTPSGEAGCHLRFGFEPAVCGRIHPGLLEGAVREGPRWTKPSQTSAAAS
jgi:hypothetical protein